MCWCSNGSKRRLFDDAAALAGGLTGRVAESAPRAATGRMRARSRHRIRRHGHRADALSMFVI
jgi:hypothetical protein